MNDRVRDKRVEAMDELALTLEMLSFWGSKFIGRCFKVDYQFIGQCFKIECKFIGRCFKIKCQLIGNSSKWTVHLSDSVSKWTVNLFDSVSKSTVITDHCATRTLNEQAVSTRRSKATRPS